MKSYSNTKKIKKHARKKLILNVIITFTKIQIILPWCVHTTHLCVVFIHNRQVARAVLIHSDNNALLTQSENSRTTKLKICGKIDIKIMM